jgi:peptidoglycan/xylan/chitin deacetylase (PgdA/CDA1 family)
MTRTSIKAAAAKFLYSTGIERAMRPHNVPVVIAYHRVVEDFASASVLSNPSMLVSLEMLEKHLDWIGRRYRFVDLDELGARLESGDAASSSVAAVTFDDGYRDFYHLALPLLQRKGIPAAIFAVTGHIGTKAVPLHDRLYLLLKRRRGEFPSSLRGLPEMAEISHTDPYTVLRTILELLPTRVVQFVADTLEADDPVPDQLWSDFHSLSWDELARVHRAGITVGSHTRTHVLMPNEEGWRVVEEAASSRQILQQKLGAPIRHFAYPSGAFDSASVRAVATAGYRYAYATMPRRNSEQPLLTIPRTVLWEKSCVGAHSAFSGEVLNCQIHHAFDAFASETPLRQEIAR